MTREEVAEALGVHPRSVARLLRRYGVRGKPLLIPRRSGSPPMTYEPADIERVRLARLEEARALVVKLGGGNE